MMNNAVNSRIVARNYFVLPILIISLCSLFQFYKFILQVYPSIITNQLMGDFHLTGAGLGNLAATFYYSYMITQLFVGIILDRYSIRWVASLAILNCALGSLLFAQAHTTQMAEISRALMGVGVAFSTVTYMKLAAIWFPPRRYAFISGLLATAAMTGAVCGEAPLSWLMNSFGWRECLYFVGLAGLVLAALFAFTIRDISPFTQIKSVSSTRISSREILLIIKNKQNWLLSFYCGLAFSPVAVFGGLWGNPFLQQAYNLSKAQAASMVSLVFIGLGLGGPLIGMFSDRLGKRRNVMFFSTLISCASLILVLYFNSMPIEVLSTLLFIFGFCLGAFMLAFAIGKELNNINLTATVIAMINASDAFLDGITEPGIGKLLDLGWDGKVVNGVHSFSLHSYHIALAVLPLYLLAAALLLFWIKEKKSSPKMSMQA